MLNFFRWLFGYVEFAFTKGFVDGFINDCFNQKINIHNLKANENGITGTCVASEYKRLHSIAFKHGGIVKITKRHGALFVFLKLRVRSGLLLGALAFIIIINTLGGFVWSVDVVGAKAIPSEEIIEILEKNGFHEGVNWKSVSTSSLENLIMATYKECGWIHINRYGSRAVVEISEAVLQPEIDNANGRANLKASKDGVIVYTNIKRGWDIVKVGSAVTKGDLLASGVFESELNKTNHFTHASGEVIARVKEPFKLTINRQQSAKVYTEENDLKQIEFFGLSIPLYIKKIETQNCEITEKTEYLKLNEKALPIGITTKKCKKYYVETYNLTNRDLEKLTKSEIEKKLNADYKPIQIVSKKISINLNDESAIANGYVYVLEDIATEVEF